ncbi:MAG TPA: hypothetical protein PKD53_11970, partial [Chloroflexaceae bacterium]|nr:hypothetical protein [Chloroflexaceae bacterium]
MRRQARLIAPLALACALALVGCQSPVARPPTPVAAPAAPTAALTSAPTAAPTAVPTDAAPTLAPTLAPTEAPTEAPTTAPTEAPTAAPSAPPAPTSPPLVSTIGAEILFLRGGTLTALDPATGAERALADGVGDFAATADGRLIAMVRGEGAAAEIWLAGRDGAGLR